MNVTFFTDGQQGVAKTPGVVEVLLELSGAQNKQLQEKAILVLRNLCFHGASKPVLLVNGKGRHKTSCKLREKNYGQSGFSTSLSGHFPDDGMEGSGHYF